jgi:hypothetical protein
MRKRIIIIGCSLLAFTLVLATIWNFAGQFGGSYPFGEQYEFNCNEIRLITAIENFKKANAMYAVPTYLNLVDGRKDSSDYWYHIYIYYPYENQIIYFWTRPNLITTTELCFIAINDGYIIGNWKNINKDFPSSENKAVKALFEQRILKNIGIPYTKKGNGMSLW